MIQGVGSRIQARLTAMPPRTWAKAGAGVLATGVVLGWFVFPYVIDKAVGQQINLAKGKDTRNLWIHLPPVNFNAYIFNITNPREVMQGDKPNVQEIGPYCYKLIKDKLNIVEDSTEDTISYSARATWVENQKGASCPAPELTGEEQLVVPNIPMMAILLIANKDFPPALLNIVNQALPAIFGPVKDVFMKVTARQLLFGGVTINCSATALFPRTVCIALKQNSRGLKQLGPDQYSFSFFGARNHTPEEFRYTVKRGTEDPLDIGRLVAVDGRPELPFWRGECNKIMGTDGSVFPPFRVRENGSLSVYGSEICRTLVGNYEGDMTYKGITGYAYTAMVADLENNPGEWCYCPTDRPCRKKGVIDVLKCQGAPVVISHPHFYLGSQEYITGVTGLNPSKDKHGILLLLEPLSGSPLMVRKRIQLNMDLKPIPYVTVTQRLRRTLTPLVWAEEWYDLDGDLVGMLEASLFRPMRALDVIKWLAVVAGVGLGATAAALKYRATRRDKVHVLSGDPKLNGNGTVTPGPGVIYSLSAKGHSSSKRNSLKLSTAVNDEYYKRETQNVMSIPQSPVSNSLLNTKFSNQNEMKNVPPSYELDIDPNNGKSVTSYFWSQFMNESVNSTQPREQRINSNSLTTSSIQPTPEESKVNTLQKNMESKSELFDNSQDISESNQGTNHESQIKNQNTNEEQSAGTYDIGKKLVKNISDIPTDYEDNNLDLNEAQIATYEEVTNVQLDIIKLKDEIALLHPKSNN